MGHDDTTYLDDEGMDYVDLGDDGECKSICPVTVTAGGRRWGQAAEEWGGWDAE